MKPTDLPIEVKLRVLELACNVRSPKPDLVTERYKVFIQLLCYGDRIIQERAFQLHSLLTEFQMLINETLSEIFKHKIPVTDNFKRIMTDFEQLMKKLSFEE